MRSMQFTDTMQGGIAGWSPDGRWLHHVLRDKVYFRDLVAGLPLRMFTACDVVAALEWSCDSAMVLLAVTARDAVQVFDAATLKEVARIEEGGGGLASARWAPDARWIVTCNSATTRATVWPLADRPARRPVYFGSPKRGAGCIAFSADGQRAACLCRSTDHSDAVCVADCGGVWAQTAHFACSTEDAAALAFAPIPERTLLVVEAPPALRCRIFTDVGELLRTVDAAAEAPPRAPVAAAAAPLVWSFSADGAWFAVCARAGVALYETLNWGLASHFALPPEGPPDVPEGVLVFTEDLTKGPDGEPRPKYLAASGREAVLGALGLGAARQQDRLRAASSGAEPLLCFSGDGDFLAFCSHLRPDTVWVVDMRELRLHAALRHSGCVRDVAWQRGDAHFGGLVPAAGSAAGPGQQHLAIVTGSRHVYFWHPRHCCCAAVPPPESGAAVAPTQCDWRPLPDAPRPGSAERRAQLLLADVPRQALCVCYP